MKLNDKHHPWSIASTQRQLINLFIHFNNGYAPRIRFNKRTMKGALERDISRPGHENPSAGPTLLFEYQVFIEFCSPNCAREALNYSTGSIVNMVAIELEWAQSPKTCIKCYHSTTKHPYKYY